MAAGTVSTSKAARMLGIRARQVQPLLSAGRQAVAVTVLYLLDANVFIDANRDYYPIERVPEFWDWLTEMGELGAIKTPQEIYEEIVLPLPAQRDPLVEWLRTHRAAVLLDEEVEVGLVGLSPGSRHDEDEVEKIGRDPFLIAYALADASTTVCGTRPPSKPDSAQRQCA